MAKDVGDLIGNAIGSIAREAAQSLSGSGSSKNGISPKNIGFGRNGNGALSGSRGVLAGAAVAAAAPVAAKGARKLVRGATKRVEPAVGKGVKDAVGKKIDEAGGAPGLAKEAGKGMLPFGGGGDSKSKKKGTPGVGKGRRMPVQQAVDISVPLAVAYNQFTQFEEWPQFMHRLQQATQEDDCTVSFKTKIWGISKEFEASIIEQRPDERIAWTVTQGITHTGVVNFHELSDRLTRVQLTLDVDPGSLIEKAARGMRQVKRAVRADLARFKAFVEMQEVETGAWRGMIHDGELVEEHDESYDRGREYAEFDDIYDTESSHSPQQQNGSSSRRRSSSSNGGSSRRQSSGPRRARTVRSASGRGRSSSSGRSGSSSQARGRSSSGSRGRASSSRASSNRASSNRASSSRSRTASSARGRTSANRGGRSASSRGSGSSSSGRSGTSRRSSSASSRGRR